MRRPQARVNWWGLALDLVTCVAVALGVIGAWWLGTVAGLGGW